MEVLKILEKGFIEIANLIKDQNSLVLSNQQLSSNQSGDDVKKLDILANDLLKDLLQTCPQVRTIGSEEEDTLIYTPHTEAPYLVCFDPLDGSSNIDVNITTGTIFAIYKYNDDGTITNGHNIIMAGYCLYGGATQYIVASSEKLQFFQYHWEMQKFQCIKNNMKISNKGKIYSINESNKNKWLDTRYQQFIEQCIEKKYSARWVGSLVADGHRTIIKGGFFAYPANSKDTTGKIRLLYEAYPFAFLFHVGGGKASNGSINLLDVPFPENIHQKTPIILASSEDMNMFQEIEN
jgi:fructose-1,6-bisphosphatase I